MFNKKLFTHQTRTKRFKSLKTCYETIETAKMHKKLKYGQKRQKKLRNTKICLGMIFMTKYQKKILLTRTSFFDQKLLKTLQLLELFA